MQTIRRRGWAAPADARAGEKASRQGKASETPAARRTWRRVSFMEGTWGRDEFVVGLQSYVTGYLL